MIEVRRHRKTKLTSVILLLALALHGCAEDASSDGRSAPTGPTLHIAPPTGVKDTDRRNVQAALDSVQAGETVQFGAGTYLLGEGVYLRVPDVTVLGHPDGTVLRGCDPDAFDVPESELMSLVLGCTGFFVQAERQTIRDLTFEYAWHGIVVGPYPSTMEELIETQGLVPPYPAGGQRIEGNTFRATPNGMRMLGMGEDISIVRDNDFIDTFHAIGIYGPAVHFLENRVRVEQSGRVPTSRHPASAVLVSPGPLDCPGHVIAGNTIEGHPGAIYVLSHRGGVCRGGVEIRDNDIEVVRVPVPQGWVIPTTEDDTTLVGVPITLATQDQLLPGAPEDTPEGVLEEILVQGNRIVGAEGIGILVEGSGHRILDNVITDVRRRAPFPGNNWDPSLVTWEAANGSGIWVAPGARGNELRGNRFQGIDAAAVMLEGDENTVDLVTATDSVADLGTSNRVSGPSSGG